MSPATMAIDDIVHELYASAADPKRTTGRRAS